jgi:predicted HicB family RNase H-like nuclease
VNIPSATGTLGADLVSAEGMTSMGRKKMKTAEKLEEKIDIRLRVDGELHGRIQAAADQEGNSVAAFIRTAVVEKLKRIERGADS